MPTSLDTVAHAVGAAMRLCIEAADSPSIEKRGEPVTVADFGSQALLLRAIAISHPDDAVFAEESSSDLDEAGVAADVTDLVSTVLGVEVAERMVRSWIDHRGAGDSGRVWAVDPIDGTKGFLRGDQFAVAVGLIVAGQARGGVLGCPRLTVGEATGVMLVGDVDAGVSLVSLGGEEDRVSVSAIDDTARARVLGSVEAAHGDPAVISGVVERAGLGGGWVRLDSQAKYAAVAAGLAEVYVRPRSRADYQERVWDHAAGAALVTAAGGRVTDFDGEPLDFGTGATLTNNRGVVATNGHLHDRVLAAVGDLERAAPG